MYFLPLRLSRTVSVPFPPPGAGLLARASLCAEAHERVTCLQPPPSKQSSPSCLSSLPPDASWRASTSRRSMHPRCGGSTGTKARTTSAFQQLLAKQFVHLTKVYSCAELAWLIAGKTTHNHLLLLRLNNTSTCLCLSNGTGGTE
jgi:hypothetical protein